MYLLILLIWFVKLKFNNSYILLADNNSNDQEDEEEFDREGRYAEEEAHKIVDDLILVDKARKGDPEAKQTLDKKYSQFKGKLDQLEKIIEEDFLMDKVDRDADNKAAGRPVSPHPYDSEYDSDTTNNGERPVTPRPKDSSDSDTTNNGERPVTSDTADGDNTHTVGYWAKKFLNTVMNRDDD